jgi:hypothetical protein
MCELLQMLPRQTNRTDTLLESVASSVGVDSPLLTASTGSGAGSAGSVAVFSDMVRKRMAKRYCKG